MTHSCSALQRRCNAEQQIGSYSEVQWTIDRTALVSDMLGLTRDRRECDAQIADRVVHLVGSAGLEDAEEAVLQRVWASKANRPPRMQTSSYIRRLCGLSEDSCSILLIIFDVLAARGEFFTGLEVSAGECELCLSLVFRRPGAEWVTVPRRL